MLTQTAGPSPEAVSPSLQQAPKPSQHRAEPSALRARQDAAAAQMGTCGRAHLARRVMLAGQGVSSPFLTNKSCHRFAKTRPSFPLSRQGPARPWEGKDERRASPSDSQGHAGGRWAAPGGWKSEGGGTPPGVTPLLSVGPPSPGRNPQLGAGAKRPGVQCPRIFPKSQLNQVATGPPGFSAPGAHRPAPTNRYCSLLRVESPQVKAAASTGESTDGCVGCLHSVLLRTGLETGSAETQPTAGRAAARGSVGMRPPPSRDL